ncbi:nucleoside phosphorylase [Paenibacillus sp. CGMCC 1.16610]|uniref:Uridine phosphorylase n=1 Tax=Paenibacillus anseongense TaxID=2682845 RepID=A0ABW9UHQ0_9BACL|nr:MULTISPECIES: nucleoside phosphorylase [Paenibacillus]MBA2938337.1 nucleoside phosphorylase [Paenibacillus sp. CGMCC 1.16610]MVQ37395.1 purine-nucleoside phosphorylase [Paenibacillus anseongense]
MKLSILQVNTEDLSPYAIVCGDPFRAEAIARKLDNVRELAFSREYRTFVGEVSGVAITVVSHGVGSPGAAVCFEELIKGGVKTLIRVGTAGSYSAEVPPGSLVVSTAAVREDGLTRQLVPVGFPAVADSDVVRALFEAASETDGLVKKGITVTLDAFFQGVEEFPHRKYKQAGALAVEMEISALYVIAALRGVRAGAIVALDGYADADLREVYDPHTDVVSGAVEREIDAAIRAIVKLNQ